MLMIFSLGWASRLMSIDIIIFFYFVGARLDFSRALSADFLKWMLAGFAGGFSRVSPRWECAKSGTASMIPRSRPSIRIAFNTSHIRRSPAGSADVALRQCNAAPR